MLAIRAHEFGPADVLRQDEVPTPELLPSEILTRVVASGVNPIEWKIRSGEMGRVLGRPLPATFGWECAGVVTAVGDEVHDFKVGDAVCAMLEFSREGTHAQMVAIPAAQAALKPKTLDFAEAAALPMTGQAAWSALDAAKLNAGDRVLIHGAGGAVGHWLVQLAKAAGLQIVATTSADQLALVRVLGAGEVLDYRTQRFEDAGKFAAVFDLVGSETQERSWAILDAGGRLVSLVQPPAEARNGATGMFVFTAPRGEVLAKLVAMIDSGALEPLPIAVRFPLKDAAEAHALGEAGEAHGKMILDVPPA